MLALLAEAARQYRSGNWTGPPPPVFETLSGIELRPRVAALAQRALQDEATIIVGDARRHVPATCQAALCFDVLHMMPAEDQPPLLSALAAALQPGGVILVREADAGAGWRFTTVRAGNRVKALVFGNWRQTFHFRTAREWSDLFGRLGFAVQVRAAGEGTPFANVLFVLSRPAPGSA
jgi:hypothetical protein